MGESGDRQGSGVGGGESEYRHGEWVGEREWGYTGGGVGGGESGDRQEEWGGRGRVGIKRGVGWGERVGIHRWRSGVGGREWG